MTEKNKIRDKAKRIHDYIWSNKDEKYLKFAEEQAKLWALESNAPSPIRRDIIEDLILTNILNDNTYDYKSYVNDSYGSPEYMTTKNGGHFTDKYKTVWHPTFSNESQYSNNISDYNPNGIEGGYWEDNTYRLSKDLEDNNWNILRTKDYLDEAETKPINLLSNSGMPIYISNPKGEGGYYYNPFKDGSDIYIKPSHRGRLTALKLRTGKSETELYRTGGPEVRKMITFARNARKWKHDDGGNIYDGNNISTIKEWWDELWKNPIEANNRSAVRVEKDAYGNYTFNGRKPANGYTYYNKTDGNTYRFVNNKRTLLKLSNKSKLIQAKNNKRKLITKEALELDNKIANTPDYGWKGARANETFNNYLGFNGDIGPFRFNDNYKRDNLALSVDPVARFSLDAAVGAGVSYLFNNNYKTNLDRKPSVKDEAPWERHLGFSRNFSEMPINGIRFAGDYNKNGTLRLPNAEYYGMPKYAKKAVIEGIQNRDIQVDPTGKWTQRSENFILPDDGRLTQYANFSIRENNNSGIYDVFDTYDFDNKWYTPNLRFLNRKPGYQMEMRDTIHGPNAIPELYNPKFTKKKTDGGNIFDGNKSSQIPLIADRDFYVDNNGRFYYDNDKGTLLPSRETVMYYNPSYKEGDSTDWLKNYYVDRDSLTRVPKGSKYYQLSDGAIRFEPTIEVNDTEGIKTSANDKPLELVSPEFTALTTGRALANGAIDIAIEPVAKWMSNNPYTTKIIGAGIEAPMYSELILRRLIDGDNSGGFVLNLMDATIGLGALSRMPTIANNAYNITKQGLNWSNRNYVQPYRLYNEINKTSPVIELLNPTIRTRLGDVEIDNPNLFYRQDNPSLGAFDHTNSYVQDGMIIPGLARIKGQNNYSWWNKGKPFLHVSVDHPVGGINSKSTPRLFTAVDSNGSFLKVRDLNYPIGQWNGKKGFVLQSEYVLPEAVDVSNSTYIYEPNYGYRKITTEPEVSTIDFNTARTAQELPTLLDNAYKKSIERDNTEAKQRLQDIVRDANIGKMDLITKLSSDAYRDRWKKAYPLLTEEQIDKIIQDLFSTNARMDFDFSKSVDDLGDAGLTKITPYKKYIDSNGITVEDYNLPPEIFIANNTNNDVRNTGMHEMLHALTSNLNVDTSNNTLLYPNSNIIEFPRIKSRIIKRGEPWLLAIMNQNYRVMPEITLDVLDFLNLKENDIIDYFINLGYSESGAKFKARKLIDDYLFESDIQEGRAYIMTDFYRNIAPNIKDMNNAEEIELYILLHPESLSDTSKSIMNGGRKATLKQWAKYMASALSTIPFVLQNTINNE